ncbi:putative xylosyltransferase 2-like [Capsicum annuum]|uniref:Proton pump-interactor 1-like n=1 Tax=Capsicum annuum TaxID=4072 RepID=A0A2G2YTB3_CAPAN|nr:putative xylosyltransferase 2-like [Capsicum annuum]PHT73000.1 hypothetical protein T459_23785 [Capsicum annuum]
MDSQSEKNNLMKENEKMNPGVEVNEPIKFGSHGTKESIKEEGKKVPVIGLRKEAAEDWPEPRKIHSFYLVRYRRFEDQNLKSKFDQAEKELQKMNQARFQLIEKLRAIRAERSQLIGQRKSVSAENQEFWTVIEGKRKEIKPLQDALGKLRGPRKDGREGVSTLCSSEEELDNLIKSLQYRIQHESITLTEEKKILREIKQLEGTRGGVKEQVALRAQIQDSMGEKETIQKQVKLISGNLDGVHKEQQAVKAKRKILDDQLDANTCQIKSLDEELKEVTKKRDTAFVRLQELRNQREEANAPFYKNFALLQKAKLLAAKKDTEALKELSLTEVDKFISLWSGKPFRDDYERRILTSLDIRQLSRDGRMRNPDEKPLVLPQAQTVPQTEIVEKTTAKPKPSKEEAVPAQKVNKEKITKKPKDAINKVTESTTKKYVFDVEEEIHGLEKQPKDVKPKIKESDDDAKLKEMKREEEIAKNRQAMERKKKKAEKAAAKAAIKAQKEAEKRKLKEIILIILPFELEKKAKKAGASVLGQDSTEEPTETAAEVAEEEKVEENIETSVAPKRKEGKGKNVKHQPIRAKGTEIPKTILKRKKAMNYWLWAAPAALVVPLLLLAYTHFV